MNARKLFNEYRCNKLEIARLKADKCYRRDTVKGSSADSPYTMHPISISGVDGAQLRSNRILLEKLEADCAWVEAAVNLAPNSQLRLILRLRYLDGLRWDAVAAEIVSNGVDVSETSIKKSAYRYFDELDNQQPKSSVSRKKKQ